MKKHCKRIRAIFLNKAIIYKKPYRERNKQNLNFTPIIKRKRIVINQFTVTWGYKTRRLIREDKSYRLR